MWVLSVDLILVLEKPTNSNLGAIKKVSLWKITIIPQVIWILKWVNYGKEILSKIGKNSLMMWWNRRLQPIS